MTISSCLFQSTKIRWGLLASIIAVMLIQAPLPALADASDKVLRVCAPPNDLPNSNQAEEGFENKIAELIAQELGGWKVKYDWFPQTTGYARNTLRKKDDSGQYVCDVIIGVPQGLEAMATTRPYYRSTYALVFRAGSSLDKIQTPDDILKMPAEEIKKLRIVVFVPSPGVDWLLRNNLGDQAMYHPIQVGELAWHPARLIEEQLMTGNADGVILWGPIAGYQVRKSRGKLRMVAFPKNKDPVTRFDYAFSAATRYGEKNWLAQIQDILDKNQGRIQEILRSYGVPLIDESGNTIPPKN